MGKVPGLRKGAGKGAGIKRISRLTDDKSNRGSPDRDRIDVSDPDELRNWSKSLNKTEEEIKDAVRVVGNDASKVREHFAAG